MKIRGWHIVLVTAVVMATIGCSTKKNTATTRRWHAFNARYNTYFNGSQAFIEGNLEKEKGHQDNFTEMLPLYQVGNPASWNIGQGQYDRAIEKSEKAIRRHSIKTKPEWKGNRRKTAKDREWLGRKEYNPFIWRAWKSTVPERCLRGGCCHLHLYEQALSHPAVAERTGKGMAREVLHGTGLDVRC